VRRRVGRAEFDGPTVRRDGVVQLTLEAQGTAEVVMPADNRGSSSRARRYSARASSVFPWSQSVLPRLLWAGAKPGSSSRALRYSATASSNLPLVCRETPRL
jgi:hypothetical protein